MIQPSSLSSSLLFIPRRTWQLSQPQHLIQHTHTTSTMNKIKEIFAKPDSETSHSDNMSSRTADHNPTSNTGMRSTSGDTGLGSKGAETTTTRGNAGGIAAQGQGLGAGGFGGQGIGGGQNTTGSEMGSGGVATGGAHHRGQHETLDAKSHRHERDIVPSEGERTTSDHKHLAAVTSRFLSTFYLLV